MFTRLVLIQIWYQFWSWSHSKGSEHTAAICLPGVHGPLRVVQVSPQHQPIPAACGHWLLKKPLAVLKLGKVGSQGVTRVEQVEFTRPMQVQIWSWWGGLNTGTLEAVPPAVALKPFNSISPYMFLTPPKLLAVPPPEPRVSALRESVLGPFKRNAWVSSIPLSHPEFLLIFTARCCGIPCYSAGTSAAEISLWIFAWMWNQPVSHLHPFYQSPCGFFFISLVIGFLFS